MHLRAKKHCKFKVNIILLFLLIYEFLILISVRFGIWLCWIRKSLDSMCRNVKISFRYRLICEQSACANKSAIILHFLWCIYPRCDKQRVINRLLNWESLAISTFPLFHLRSRVFLVVGDCKSTRARARKKAFRLINIRRSHATPRENIIFRND